MSIEKTRAYVTAKIWQAIAQSEIDLSGVPKEQQTDFVNHLAENLLITVNDVLDQVDNQETPEVDDDGIDEKILWEGRPFLSLLEKYVVTTERLKIIRGLVSRDIENFVHAGFP